MLTQLRLAGNLKVFYTQSYYTLPVKGRKKF